MKKILKMSAVLLALAVVLPGVFAAKTAKPKVDFYMETLAPQTWQIFFLLNAVNSRLPGELEMGVVPLVYKDEKGGWKLGQSRGDGLEEAKRLVLIKKLYKGKLWNYMSGRSLNPWPDGWRDAARFAGIDPAALDSAVEKQGDAALEKAFEEREKLALNFPAVFINGVPYTGDFSVVAVLEYVNGLLPAEKRAAIPALPKVAPENRAKMFAVVADSGNFGQANEQLAGGFKKLLEPLDPVFTQVTVSQAKKMKEFDGVNIDFLPFYAVASNPAVNKILDSNLKSGVLIKNGGLISVSNSGRPGIFLNKQAKEKTLEIFVMSQCPYGMQAMNSFAESVKAKVIPEGVKLRLRYITTVTEKEGKKNYSSLHGSGEWEEDARQLLIQARYPEKLWQYLVERNKDARSSRWETAAEAAGLRPEEISQHFNEGLALMEEDAKYSDDFGINASPTFLWEGRAVVQGMAELKKIKGFENLKTSGNPDGSCSD